MPAPTIDEPPELPSFPTGPGRPDQPGVFIPMFLAFLTWFTAFRAYLVELIAYLEGLGGGGTTGNGWIVSTVTETEYTLSEGDMDAHLRFVAADPVTVLAPPDSGFTAGQSVRMTQAGEGTVAIVAGEGVTVNALNGLISEGQFAVFELEYVGSEEWDAMGDLIAGRPDWLPEGYFAGVSFIDAEAYIDDTLITDLTDILAGLYDPANLSADGYTMRDGYDPPPNDIQDSGIEITSGPLFDLIAAYNTWAMRFEWFVDADVHSGAESLLVARNLAETEGFEMSRYNTGTDGMMATDFDGAYDTNAGDVTPGAVNAFAFCNTASGWVQSVNGATAITLAPQSTLIVGKVNIGSGTLAQFTTEGILRYIFFAEPTDAAGVEAMSA